MSYLSIDGYVNRYTYSGESYSSKVERLLLSNSQNGKQISITGFNVSGFSLIHQTQDGTGHVDEIFLYASNHAPSGIGDVDLTLSWGHDIPLTQDGQVGADARNGEMKITIPYEAARFQVIDGKLLQNGLSVKGFETLATGLNDGYPVLAPPSPPVPFGPIMLGYQQFPGYYVGYGWPTANDALYGTAAGYYSARVINGSVLFGAQINTWPALSPAYEYFKLQNGGVVGINMARNWSETSQIIYVQ